MAQTIQASVGSGGMNLRTDVTLVQTLLNLVFPAQGGPAVPLVVDGSVGPKTIGAITSFQRAQFGLFGADGRVDPGQQTFARLLSFGPTIAPAAFQGFGTSQIATLKGDLERAKRMIDNAQSLMALAPFLNATAQGPDNVVRLLLFNFGVDFTDKSNPVNFAFQSTNLFILRGRFAMLRASITDSLPFVLDPPAAFGTDARVLGTDPTIHIAPQYFAKPADERSATLVHEIAHTRFGVPGHPGIGGGLAVLVVGPTDDKRPFFRPAGNFVVQAFDNPFCYEWLLRGLDKGASALAFSGFGAFGALNRAGGNCKCGTSP